MPNDPRKALERLCAERGEDFAGLSRFLGKNPAYIQQFIRRGTPRRLREDERRKLARYFGVPESLLGGPPRPIRRRRRAGAVTRSRWCAPRPAPAPMPDGEQAQPYFAFDQRWLKALTGRQRRRSVDHPRRGQFDGADAQRRGRHIGRPGGLQRGAARRHLCASGRRQPAGQAAGDPPHRPPRHRPVGQSRLSRLARLLARRCALHRPRDLGGAQDCVSESPEWVESGH